MLEKCRENFPSVLGAAKRGANSLGAVSTPAEQHNQWTSNQRPFAVFFLMQSRQIYFKIWTNTFQDLEKYISKSDDLWDKGGGASSPSLIYQLLDKYISQFKQIHFKIWTNTFQNLDKYISQFGQIYITILTNTIHNLDKYIS